jgi:hypothetical protein
MDKKNVGLLIAFLILGIITFTINLDEVRNLLKTSKVEAKVKE